MGGASGPGGRSYEGAGTRPLWWARLGGACECRAEMPWARVTAGLSELRPPRPPQASPVTGPSICTSAGTTLHPTPLPVRPALGICPGTATVSCREDPRPTSDAKTSLLTLVPDGTPPQLPGPLGLDVSVCVPPQNIPPLSFSDDHQVIFFPFHESVSAHLGLPCLTSSVTWGSTAQLCPTICHPVDCRTPGSPVLHSLPEFAHAPVH